MRPAPTTATDATEATINVVGKGSEGSVSLAIVKVTVSEVHQHAKYHRSLWKLGSH